MKRTALKLITIFTYVFLLLYFLEFEVKLLLGWKELLLTVLGTALLSLPYYEKKTSFYEFGGIMGRNALVTSYLVTFMLLFARLSKDLGYENLLADIAYACRPILYGFVIYILLRKEEENRVGVGEEVKTKYTVEQIHDRLRKMGLTKREVEVAMRILNGLSNREIAEELYISETTVKKHVSHIFEKLSVSKREQIWDVLHMDPNPDLH